ncbi:MAG: DUF2868 domain-containing protein [Deltaproteobacteria bacterium]|nr:DUF2868 domain-containing protein [Deltaproteobacteria bacterium]
MTLRDFVLVEFARAWQEEQGAARVDPEVVGLVREHSAFQEASGPERLLLYAQALLHLRLDDGEGQAAAQSIRGTLSAASILVPLLGVLAGTAMLGAALPPPDVRPVSVFQFVAEGVLLPGVFLVWTLLITQALAGSVGRLHWVAWLLTLVRGRALRTRVGALAGRVLKRSGVTGPLFANFSHIFWVCSLGTFLGLGLWRFAFTDYLFSWSSTLSFTGEQVHRLFGVLSAPVAWIPGVDAPSMEQVRLSEFGSLGLAGETGGAYVQSTADALADQGLRKGWVSVLLAIVAVWGLLPRILAVFTSRAAVGRRIRRSLEDPTSRMILAALSPAPSARGAEPDRSEPHAPSHPEPASITDRAGRGLDVLTFATDPPSPAVLDRLRLSRLGLSGTVAAIASDDDDDAMDAAIAHLGSADGPEGAVVTFGVEAIPDGLKEEFIARVVGAVGRDAAVHVLLTGGERFKRSPRGSRFAQRLTAWRDVAHRAGVPAERVHSDVEESS